MINAAYQAEGARMLSMNSEMQRARKNVVLNVGSRGFFVSTNDVSQLGSILESECRYERVGEGRYYFEFVMPFHTPAEASFHLKHVLREDQYSVVTKSTV